MIVLLIGIQSSLCFDFRNHNYIKTSIYHCIILIIKIYCRYTIMVKYNCSKIRLYKNTKGNNTLKALAITIVMAHILIFA